MPKRKSDKDRKKKTKKIGSKPVKNPNGGLKACLRCSKQFMSTDVCRNRICVPCSRLNNREWSPGVYRPGVHIDGDDY